MRFEKPQRWTELDESMLKRGWIRTSVAAQKMGVSVMTVNRAIREEQIEHTVAAGTRYLSIKSCIEWLGEEAAEARGLLGKKRAS